MSQNIKVSLKKDFQLNWSLLQEGARLMIEPSVEEWSQAVFGFKGLDIQITNLVQGQPKSVYSYGDLVGEQIKLPLRGMGIGDVNVYFYGVVLADQRYQLIIRLETALAWLVDIQHKFVGALSFKHSPLIMYHAAELDGRWVLLDANKALTDFLGIDGNDLIGVSARTQVLDFVHPDDLQKLITSYDYIRTTTKNMALNYRMRGADGSYVSVIEYIRYSQDVSHKRSQSVLWLKPDEPPKFSDASDLFKDLDTFMQDISFETGRDFLVHFCRRFEASKKIPWLVLCVPVSDDWWETWIVSRRGYLQPVFAFQPKMIKAIESTGFNQRVEADSDCFEKNILFGGHPFVSSIKLADDSERNQAYFLFGTPQPIQDIDGFEKIITFAGKRVLREVWQARQADAQVAQNEVLLRQKNHLTNMVTLLGQLDTVADESEFLSLVQTNLQQTFNLSSLDLVYWSSGDWHEVLQERSNVTMWNRYSALLQNASWIQSLEECRRGDNLIIERATGQVYWPVGQSHAGYLVMVMTIYSEMPDLELLNFSRNALSLALQGLMQRENLRLQAMRDSLTGLGNRTQLHAWIKVALPSQTQASLLLFDLNRFKEINDSFGHQFGDKLLCEIGPRISRRLSDWPHYLARLGGDEFALFFPGISQEETKIIAGLVSQALSESYFIDRLRFQVEASVGVAHYPEHGTDGHELLRCADVAMYEAKNSAKPVVVFSGDLDNTTPLRIAVLSELDQALSEGQLNVVYQPLMSTNTGLTGGFEALVRWTHPEFGPLSPAEFIAIAEMGEGIRKITDFVVRKTMENLKIWRKIVPQLHVAVNISPRVLLDHQFPKIIQAMLKEYDLPGESIIMELTESTLLVDPVRAVEIINVLGDIGIKVEIDDYGTGYSSLAYIKSLPISALKIDRSFVLDLLKDETNQVIVSSTIKMAHTLGLQTVAEGVEDEATLMMLLKYGCDMIQGYYYAKPIPEQDVVSWLKRNT